MIGASFNMLLLSESFRVSRFLGFIFYYLFSKSGNINPEIPTSNDEYAFRKVYGIYCFVHTV